MKSTTTKSGSRIFKNIVLLSYFIAFYCSPSSTEADPFISFDFQDGVIEKGFDDWYYSDKGTNPCDVYAGEKQSKMCNRNGYKIYPYFNNYNTDHMGWLRYGYIDASAEFSVSGLALKVQATGGAHRAKGGGVEFSGVPAKSKSDFESALMKRSISSFKSVESYPGDISLYFKTKSNTSRFKELQGKNRLALWILMPYKSINIENYTLAQLGRPEQRISWYPFINSSKGAHYYHHSSNIPMGGWTKVQFDGHPTHNNAGSKNSYSAFASGGYEFPGSSVDYFSNIVTFSIAAKANRNQPMMSAYYIDDMTVDYVAYENEETINNLGVGYSPRTSMFDISFEDKYRCSKCEAEYEIRYSFSPIDNTNFDQATVPDVVINFDRNKNNRQGRLYKPSTGYNLLWGAITLQPQDIKKLTPYTKVYFAVKDISLREQIHQQDVDSERVYVPELGFVRNIDLVKTIEYQIIPVSYPIENGTKTLNRMLVNRYFEQQLKAYGGTTPLTFRAKKLPDGLKLSTSGLLSGTPSRKQSLSIQYEITDAKGLTKLVDIDAYVLVSEDLNVKHCGLLVDFKISAEKSLIADRRFKEVKTDSYTNFTRHGTTITVGSNKSYDFTLLSGSNFFLQRNDIIRTTWINNTNKKITFSPKISLSSSSRISDATKQEWKSSASIQIEAKQKAVSEYIIQQDTLSNLININVNYSNNKGLILDKIETVEKARPISAICKP